MKASTVTAVTVVGGVIAAVVGLLTIPTLLGAKNAAASTGGGTFGGGGGASDSSGGGSSALGGFFDWLGHLGSPAQSVPVVGASNPTAETQTGYPANPGTVPVAGGGLGGSTSLPYIPGVTHPVIPAPPHPTSSPAGGVGIAPPRRVQVP